jgi:filamin
MRFFLEIKFFFSDLNDYNYSIKFIPKEMGVHTVSVKHKEIHIPGSPFGK